MKRKEKKKYNIITFVNCTPKVRQKKSNFWGVFIMKLTYEDKVLIYELRKEEMIDKILHEYCSQDRVSLECSLPNQGMLPNWLAQYKKKLEEMTELERLQAENAVLKKMRELRIVVFGSIIRGFSG